MLTFYNITPLKSPISILRSAEPRSRCCNRIDLIYLVMRSPKCLQMNIEHDSKYIVFIHTQHQRRNINNNWWAQQIQRPWCIFTLLDTATNSSAIIMFTLTNEQRYVTDEYENGQFGWKQFRPNNAADHFHCVLTFGNSSGWMLELSLIQKIPLILTSFSIIVFSTSCLNFYNSMDSQHNRLWLFFVCSADN